MILLISVGIVVAWLTLGIGVAVYGDLGQRWRARDAGNPVVKKTPVWHGTRILFWPFFFVMNGMRDAGEYALCVLVWIPALFGIASRAIADRLEKAETVEKSQAKPEEKAEGKAE